jgi:hypothetical protein
MSRNPPPPRHSPPRRPTDMATQLTAEDAKQSLTAHVEAKGVEVFLKYGPRIGWGELQRLLADRAHVRYPCEVVFDAEPLLPGECAHPLQKGDTPESGFTMCVHPLFMLQLERVPWLVLYQLVAVNYGAFASSDDAETFGAAALGLTRDEYYAGLCAMADELGGGETLNDVAPAAGGCGGASACG